MTGIEDILDCYPRVLKDGEDVADTELHSISAKNLIKSLCVASSQSKLFPYSKF